MKAVLKLAVLCAVGSGVLAACGGSGDAPPQTGTVVVADVSGSAEKTGLRDDAAAQFGNAVESMGAPGKVALLAFNNEVGSATCPPVTVTLNWSDNSTEVQDNRAKLAAQAPAAAGPYFDCAKASVKKDASDVFGGIAEAATLLKDVPGAKAMVIVSDGCSNSYKVNTCAKGVADSGWRAEKLASLPDSLKPSLSGVSITFVGLARGTNLQSAQVQGLRSLYTEYAEAAGATITFKD